MKDFSFFGGVGTSFLLYTVFWYGKWKRPWV